MKLRRIVLVAAVLVPAWAESVFACVASADLEVSFASSSAAITEQDQKRLLAALNRAVKQASGNQWSVRFAVYTTEAEGTSSSERQGLTRQREESIRNWFLRREVRLERLEQPRYSSASAPAKAGNPGGYAEVSIRYACPGERARGA